MLLEIKDLHITYKNTQAVRGACFALSEGEIAGLVGPSGSGKSTIAEALLDLLPDRPAQGEILLCGENLLEKTPLQMEKMRGKTIALINQNVMTALHPTKTIGQQIDETLCHHKKISGREAKKETLKLLAKVQLLPAHYDSYPHELSGGMRQRAMIAMAICCTPKLLIADEPTTALDVTIQAEIIALLKELRLTILFITHDLSLAATLCDKIFVMHEGKIVEAGTPQEIFYSPCHPITQLLVAPKTPSLSEPLSALNPLLEVRELSKTYKTKAVENVSFSLHAGETVGLIGESGCGKSTLGKMIAGLMKPTSGTIRFDGKVQMVFQDPYGSLDPKMRVKEIIGEGFEIHGIKNRERSIRRLLSLVHLPEHFEERYPHELSGGEKQRIGIARALSIEPHLLVCDEPLSSLDTITQQYMIELFIELQRKLTLSYLFISHDLPTLRQIAHRIIVMYRGKIVEEASTEELFENPRHPYTRQLLDAVPKIPNRDKIEVDAGDTLMLI